MITKRLLCNTNKYSKISFTSLNGYQSVSCLQLIARRFMAHYISLKDEKFTVSLIGAPNVGKSTLYNTLMAKHEALVDRMPGLTRDRREGISRLFDVPVRIVDTAGFEDIENLDEPEKRSINKNMVNDMILQTRNALLYSDLAIFILDSRAGIQHNDIVLHDWIIKKKFAHQKKMHEENVVKKKPLNPEIIYDKPLKGIKDDKIYQKNLDKYENQQNELKMQRQEQQFKSSFTNKFDIMNEEDIEIPKIVYVVNKGEDGYEGDIMADIWKLGIENPLFISAEHGDGLNDLYRIIKDSIPEKCYTEFNERKAKRLQRYNEYKQMMIDELSELKKFNTEDKSNKDIDFDPNELSKEYDKLNPDPEENSDFDSDNEINPLDTITKAGYPTSIGGISTENLMKKKPIQLCVIGRPNVGKSTVVNSFLREDRVIANDLPGTTRDSISIQWVHKGRRIVLVDTAGIKIKARNVTRIEELVRENVESVLKYSHIAIMMIDSMTSFTNQDLAIMSYVIEEGRGLVVAANKWDLVADKYKRRAVKWMSKQLEKHFRQAKGIPISFVSAKTGARVNKILDEVLRVYEKWNTRVSTGLLNKWLTALKRVHQMPGFEGKYLKIRYIMQIKSRPPTFFIFVNDLRIIPEVYKRFLQNSLIKEFGFEGVPVRLLFRDNRHLFKNRDPSELNETQGRIMNRIDARHQRRRTSITFMRRQAGANFLYHRKSIFAKKQRTK